MHLLALVSACSRYDPETTVSSPPVVARSCAILRRCVPEPNDQIVAIQAVLYQYGRCIAT